MGMLFLPKPLSISGRPNPLRITPPSISGRPNPLRITPPSISGRPNPLRITPPSISGRPNPLRITPPSISGRPNPLRITPPSISGRPNPLRITPPSISGSWSTQITPSLAASFSVAVQHGTNCGEGGTTCCGTSRVHRGHPPAPRPSLGTAPRASRGSVVFGDRMRSELTTIRAFGTRRR